VAEDRIIITTENPEYVGDPIKFKINPKHLNVSQQIHKTYRKTRKGHVKGFVGNGAIVLSFMGSVTLNPRVNNTPDKTDSVDMRESAGWKWFETFAQFARSNQAYLFRLQYLGSPMQINTLNPEFIGDLDIPTFDLDADNHLMLNYSFTFTCELLSEYLPENLGITDFSTSTSEVVIV